MAPHRTAVLPAPAAHHRAAVHPVPEVHRAAAVHQAAAPQAAVRQAVTHLVQTAAHQAAAVHHRAPKIIRIHPRSQIIRGILPVDHRVLHRVY